MARCETVTYRKRTICKHSLHKHEAVAAGSGQSFYYNLIQGSYTTSNSKSANTHAVGAVTDHELDGVTWAKAYSVNRLSRSKMLLDLIRWWTGNHHGHTIDPECPNLSPEAVAQVIEVAAGGDGLIGDAKDNGDRTYVAQMYALFKQRRSVQARVKLIQRGLGIYVDGKWGPQTDAAVSKVRASKTTGVKAVQTGLLVDADGAWGPVTEKAYQSLRGSAYQLSAPVKPAPTTTKPAATTYPPTIKRGSKNNTVLHLQRELLRVFPTYAGRIRNPGGGPNTNFGSNTEAVVKEFQRRARVTVDGIVGPKTWVALKRNGVRWP